MSFWGGAGPPSKLVNMLVKWRPCQGPYEEKHAMKHAIDDFLRLRASSTSVVAPMTPRSHARSTMRWVCGVMAMQHSTQNVGRRRCWFLSSAGSARQSPFGWFSALPSIKGPLTAKVESIGPCGITVRSWYCHGMIYLYQSIYVHWWLIALNQVARRLHVA